MPTRIFGFSALYFMCCFIAKGNVIEGKKLYISRSGDDTWSCDQSKPCKTIWRAVTLASQGDHIYLDGSNTSKDPYTCQSRTAAHPGIYINKSLSLIGSASPMPQIRCTEGTGLMLVGSDNAGKMNVTLAGLLVNKSFVSVQDSSFTINGCKFLGSKQAVKIVIRTSIISSIQITNSNFSRNSECISVVVNNTKRPSQNIQAVFKVTNSSFDNNGLSDVGRCISFKDFPSSNQFIRCNITLENAKFSRNKFSSKGLVFLEMNNGSQQINLQNVTFVDNGPLSVRDVLTGDDDSKCIVRGTDVNIFIKSSHFSSQYARSFSISASNVSLQIYNSSFFGHKVKGNGGVLSLKGTGLCKLNVYNSSFVNTSAAQGGAINIECANVYSVRFDDSVFTDNRARNGEGGAVYIYSPGLLSKDQAEYSLKDNDKLDYSSPLFQQLLQINITKCYFTNSDSSSGGGAVSIDALETSIRIRLSEFSNCKTVGKGGGVLIGTSSTSTTLKSGNNLLLIVESANFTRCRSVGFDFGGSLSVLYRNEIDIIIKNSYFASNYASDGGAVNIFPLHIDETFWRKIAGHITVENSTFLDNSALGDGGAIYIVVNNQSTLILQDVIMESNRARNGGGAAAISPINILKIHQSRFLKNKANSLGGAFVVSNVNILQVQDTVFSTNYAWSDIIVGPEEFGGALYVNCGLISTSIVILNTTFNNCSAGLKGGAIYLVHRGNLSLEVKWSQFVDNFVFSYDVGGAMYLSLAPDTKINSGCIEEHSPTAFQIDHSNDFPSWLYESHLVFEHTTFKRNTAGFGGAVYLINGKATFRNCYFIDNFAAHQGGHIYTQLGSTSLVVQDSVFCQTINDLKRLDINYSKASFIHTESSGALKLNNTTMDATPYGSTGPLLLVRNGILIDIGKSNLTTFNCPVGSRIEIVNFTNQVTTQVNDKPCKVEVTLLEFSCSACAGNSYSLQRGRVLGSQVAPGFQCLPCPFGANCSQNILAKPNFWGFKTRVNPPTLKFTMCPMDYCRPPQETEFPEYNGCRGSRSGKLCGQCNESYTETLYSTNCRPSHKCKDYWFWPVTLLYVSFMALYFTFKPPIVSWIKRQILWFKNYDPANEEDDFDRGYLKIMFYFYQAANLLLVSNSSQHIFKTTFADILVGLFNFQLKFSSSGLICPFPGLTVVTKDIFSTSYVFGTCLMICAIYCWYWGVLKYRGQGAPSVGPFIGAVLQTMLLGYSTLASISFDLLRCVQIGAEKRLFYDGNVVCFQWWQYILIGFVCAFIFPFVFVLFWGCFKLYSRTLSVGKFLTACCFPLPSLLFWFFDFLICRRRNADNEDSSALSNPASEDRSPSQRTSNSVERVLYDAFKLPEDGRKLSLSWESVMIGRRLILILLKAFISDPMPRLLIMSWFCVMFLQHHSMTQPFRDSFANSIETVSLVSLVILATINMLFASFLSLAVPYNDHFSSWWNVCQGVEIVILCAVPVVFIALVVAAILSLMCRTTIVVCRCFYSLCWICFNWCYSSQNEETRPAESGTA